MNKYKIIITCLVFYCYSSMFCLKKQIYFCARKMFEIKNLILQAFLIE